MADKGPCSIRDCLKPARSLGWCAKHYSRYLRHGSPTARLRGEVVDGCRICPRCKEDKAVEEFSGTGACKACRASIAKAKRDANPAVREARKEYARRYNAANAEQLREMAVEWRKQNPDLVRKRSAARRAALSGATVEDFSPAEIFKRDEWVCHICELPVDRALGWPHPWSVSLDHVIPLSRGGDHSRANTACSHLRCNLRKYAKEA